MAPPGDPTPPDAGGPAPSSGYTALQCGDWVAAAALFEALLLEHETPEVLEALARAAWWLDDAERVLSARERAYRLFRDRGDQRGAARLAIALAGDYLGFRGEAAVARGWQQRAGQLLERLEPVPEHGWLRIAEGDFELSVERDPQSAGASAQAALAVAEQLGEEDLRTLAHALSGACRVARGELREGLSQLDAAVTAALSGDLSDPIAIGYSCCYMLYACEQARDFDRAAQWCERVHAYARHTRFSVLRAVCRAHHGSVLVGRGQWQEAEAELDTAARELARSRPGLLGEALVRLAGLRRRQGRFEEASDLLQRLGADPGALVEQARLALDRGAARTAAALAERVLRRIPDHNQTDRGSVLELMLQAQLALGEREAATRTLAELRHTTRQPAVVQEAALRLCEGLLARLGADAPGARRAFEDAVDGFERGRAPFDAATARLELARELDRAGLDDGARSELAAAARVFEVLGARAALERATRCSREGWPNGTRGTEPATRSAEPPSGAALAGAASQPRALSARELEVLRLVWPRARATAASPRACA